MNFLRKSIDLPTASDALPGRETPTPVTRTHLVLDTSMVPPFPDGFEQLVVGMGCFWGADSPF